MGATAECGGSALSVVNGTIGITSDCQGWINAASSVTGASPCVTPVSVCDTRTQAWNWSLTVFKLEYASRSLVLQGQVGSFSLPTGSRKSLHNSFRSTWIPAPEGWA